MRSRASSTLDKASPDFSRSRLAAEYRKNKVFLDQAQKELGKILVDILKEFREREFFRVRLTENRLKDVDSLYKKAVDDQASLAEIFSMGGLRDLIGFRIVCHNLQDIKQIIEVLESKRNLLTLVRQRVPKNWIKKPQATGYRGYHLDVQFKVGDKRFQAELQIRTMLQDAWANWVHHDVYKNKDRSESIPHFTVIQKELRFFSDMLFSIDSNVDLLRSHLRSLTVGPNFPTKWRDAFIYQMYSLIGFFSENLRGPEYTSVRRVDRYILQDMDICFEHEIEATSELPTLSDFLVGGDAGVNAVRDMRLFSVGRGGGEKEVLHKVVGHHPNVISVVPKEERKSNRHHYRLRCVWRGIGRPKIGHFFAPWSLYYLNAQIDHTLEIVSSQKLNPAPICYVASGKKKPTSFISDCIDDVTGRRRAGSAMSEARSGQKYIYSLKSARLGGVVLCLYAPSEAVTYERA